MTLQIIVEATDVHGQKSNPTAIELASSLTFVHRLINKALSERVEGRALLTYGESTSNSEPALVNVHIAEVRNGSVILNAIIELTQNTFAQGVVGGVIANILTPGITAMARRTKRALTRPNRASAGRTLTVTMASERVVLRTHCRYEERQHVEIVLHEESR